jgi:hypothetical protein
METMWKLAIGELVEPLSVHLLKDVIFLLQNIYE